MSAIVIVPICVGLAQGAAAALADDALKIAARGPDKEDKPAPACPIRRSSAF